MPDRIKATSALKRNNVGKWDCSATRQHDLKFVEAVQPISFIVRQDHTNLDFIVVISHDLYQVAFVTSPKLPAQIFDRQAQRFASWGQAEYELFAAIRHIVFNTRHTRDIDQYIFECQRC